eukprot:jgi/Botrbrau1/1451/Bobra.178_3s0009.1
MGLHNEMESLPPSRRELPAIAYVVVTDMAFTGSPERSEGSSRYTQSNLKAALMCMGCKPRAAHKASKTFFLDMLRHVQAMEMRCQTLALAEASGRDVGQRACSYPSGILLQPHLGNGQSSAPQKASNFKMGEVAAAGMGEDLPAAAYAQADAQGSTGAQGSREISFQQKCFEKVMRLSRQTPTPLSKHQGLPSHCEVQCTAVGVPPTGASNALLAGIQGDDQYRAETVPPPAVPSGCASGGPTILAHVVDLPLHDVPPPDPPDPEEQPKQAAYRPSRLGAATVPLPASGNLATGVGVAACEAVGQRTARHLHIIADAMLAAHITIEAAAGGRIAVVMPRAEFEDLVMLQVARHTDKLLLKDDFCIACRVREQKRSVCVLLCGTSGTGKSTLAGLLAVRLGITSVVSTDSVRHMLRSLLSRETCPVLWASTYEAATCVPGQASIGEDGGHGRDPKQRIIAGYKAQSEMVVEKAGDVDRGLREAAGERCGGGCPPLSRHGRVHDGAPPSPHSISGLHLERGQAQGALRGAG